MSEAVTFPVQNNQAQQPSGELDAHFESQLEAAQKVQDEVYHSKTWIERMFMEPQDLLEYLNATREQIERVSQGPTVVSNENIIPRQVPMREGGHAV